MPVDSSAWRVPRLRGPLRAEVEVPGSKSLTNRFLVIAATADPDSQSVVRNPLQSRDTLLMVDALRALGAEVDTTGAQWLIRGIGNPPQDSGPTPQTSALPHTPTTEIDCGLAGTVMRFLPPLAAAAGVHTHFDGDTQARVRPMSTLLDALRELGVTVSPQTAATLPFSVFAPAGIKGGALSIDAHASSQFVSALLLSAPLFHAGLDLRHNGSDLPSQPHIDMTLQTLSNAGVSVNSPNPHRWVVAPGPPQAIDVTVEPDLSNAAAFIGLALVSGGSVSIPHWPASTTQAGDFMRRIAQEFGATATLSEQGLHVRAGAQLRGVNLDLSAVGELTPVVAAIAACGQEPSTLTGIGHLRGHETDRLSALATELRRCGAQVDEGADSLAILSPVTHAAMWQSYHDHRMVMAGAIIGAKIPGLDITDPATVAKTLPQFVDLVSAAFASSPASA